MCLHVQSVFSEYGHVASLSTASMQTFAAVFHGLRGNVTCLCAWGHMQPSLAVQDRSDIFVDVQDVIRKCVKRYV